MVIYTENRKVKVNLQYSKTHLAFYYQLDEVKKELEKIITIARSPLLCLKSTPLVSE